MRSRPMPVSTLGAGSGTSGPSFTARLNCMKTLFQISIQPVPSDAGSSSKRARSGSPSPMK